MSNAASIRGPRRVKPARVSDAAPAPNAPPPLPPPAKAAAPPHVGPDQTPVAFVSPVRQASTPLPQRTAAFPAPTPVRISVRPPPPTPQMNAAVERALGSTVRIDRPHTSAEAPRVWRPLRGFIIGASLGAALMMAFTASGSDRVRETRAWMASSLRGMKKHPMPPSDPATIEAAAAASQPLPVVVRIPEPQAPAAAPPCAPAPSASAPATPVASSIPTLDVTQLPKAKPIHVWKPAPRKPAAQPRANTESDDDASDAPSGDEALNGPNEVLVPGATLDKSAMRTMFFGYDARARV